MPNSEAIEFRPVRHDDLPTLSAWMQETHWQRWWGEPEKELGEIRAMVEGRDTTRPFLFFVGGKPAGYIQYWHVGDAQHEPWLSEYPWLADLPAEAIGIDLSIGSAKDLSKGIGSTVLRQFADELHAKGHCDIVIDPDPDNHRARRAYEKAGFAAIPELMGKTPGVLLMKFDPTGTPQ